MKKQFVKIVILDAVISFLLYFLVHTPPRIYIKPTFSVQKCGSLGHFTTSYVYSVRRRTVVFTDYFTANTIWPNERVNVLKTSTKRVPRCSHEPYLWIYRVRPTTNCRAFWIKPTFSFSPFLFSWRHSSELFQQLNLRTSVLGGSNQTGDSKWWREHFANFELATI